MNFEIVAHTESSWDHCGVGVSAIDVIQLLVVTTKALKKSSVVVRGSRTLAINS